ncbi:uncharacterized protein KGF55_005081 [Candida pseudojiufengensis]|uniref:uncharacterized protein n=1 Tax=Candida pseudojiufengensis TaxID=497109 RepID=UPI0022253DF7|nr:uncharacterized protein KGF55_005081 [Candida pseudojiufengensis]KAI5959849.1 hypothetical protein KGF55_005081 [Candida pseudojiufengensis]
MLLIIVYYLLLASVSAIKSNKKPIKPSEDNFYNAPKGFKSAEPGTILKKRHVPNKLTNIFTPIKVKDAWQIMVRSENSFNEPNVIVATIIKPFNADPKKLVSYQTFEDSISPDCAPSYAIQFKSNIKTFTTQFEMFNINILLKQGYYVVIPDYQGPDASYTAGKQSGYAVLNSIIATLDSGKFTGINPKARTIMWGYSGGSLASGWAAMLQP